ncbi:MAG: alpha/beta hydrolase, partial [Alphaproteobacteria bacterium]|nr:alpha/beta hydrolase [Alphaproteobacteria bacterium]
MTGALIHAAGSDVWVESLGDGKQVVYLHGIADLHGIETEPMAFHRALAETCNVIAPAHPGCARTEEDETVESMDDVVFHYLRVFDALELDTFTLAGSSLGGWIAAEIAVRHPERIDRLALIGPTAVVVLAALVVLVGVRLLGDGAGWRLSRAGLRLERIDPVAGLRRLLTAATWGRGLLAAVGLAGLLGVVWAASGPLVAAVRDAQPDGSGQRLLSGGPLAAAERFLWWFLAAAAVVATGRS